MREQRNADDAMEAALFKNNSSQPMDASDDKSKDGTVSIERIRFLSFADMKFVKATERVGELAATLKNVVAKAQTIKLLVARKGLLVAL
jgi:hypothetical protein